MAKKNSFQAPSNSGTLKKLAGQITDNINKIYSTTHYSSPVNMRDLGNIKDGINSSINNITNINMQQTGEANISKLYSRLQNTLNDPDFQNNLEDMFNDRETLDSVMHTYTENKYIKDLDAEIDTICRYQPKLIEALETKKDNVLSADHFSKDFINPINSTASTLATFQKRADGIKTKYDLLAQAEVWYMNASKYGEQFLYIVPYSRAISKLLNNVDNTALYPGGGTKFSGKITGNVIQESFNFTDQPIKESGQQTFRSDSFDTVKHGSIKVELDMNCMLTDVIRETYDAKKEAMLLNETSLCLEHAKLIDEAARLAEATNDDPKIDSGKLITKKKLDKTMDNLDMSEFKFKDPIAQDGLNDPNAEKDKKDPITAPGCIIKKLERVYVKPYYIEDLCLGYFYMELKQSQEFSFDNVGLDSLSNSRNINKKMIENEKESDLILKQTAANISKAITPKFVNTNADISKEIYMILKYNDMYNTTNNSGADTIRVTFLPADDVVHIKFKEDPITHRGISDLEYSLFPAKLRSCIQLTYAIANMTRGYDRRVYYVKQSVETNIAKTLMNTINQLKKSNFNLRQVENVQSIFNITGMLNDYLIPTMGGDAPIQFEVMPGQRIEPPTELLTELEEQMINPTDVPLELIQARMSMDYAVHYTMTNSKFLRKIYHRQGQYQIFLSKIFTKVFNYEYDADESIQVELPPPVFLNITNTNQVISNTNEFAEQVAAIDMADEPDEMVKTIYTKKVKKHYLNSYLDISILDKFREEAQQEAAIKNNLNPSE